MISKIGDQCFSSEVRIDSSCETNIYRNVFFFLVNQPVLLLKKSFIMDDRMGVAIYLKYSSIKGL